MGLPGRLEKLMDAIDSPIRKLDSKYVHFFSKPSGKGKINNALTHPEKWEKYKAYNKVDVWTERYADQWMDEHGSKVDWKLWHLDYNINQEGVKIDTPFCESIVKIEEKAREKQISLAKNITGLDNPNSLTQLKKWLVSKGIVVESLNAESVRNLVDSSTSEAWYWHRNPA